MEIDDILIDYDDYLYIHPDFELEWFKDEKNCFIFSIDLAEGSGGDYDVLNVFQILPMSYKEIGDLKIYSDEYSFFKLVQVAMFRCNCIDIPSFAKYSYHFLTDLFVIDNVKIVMENNYEGNYFRSTLTSIYGDKNEIDDDYSICKFFYNMRDDESKAKRFGIYQTEPTKDHGCKLCKIQIKNNQMILTESITINEALAFAKNPKKKGKGSYESMIGNDDAIMTCVNVSHVRTLEDFQELVDMISISCPREFWKAIGEKLKKSELGSDDNDNNDISDLF